jgi:hypothetical protein
VRLSISSRIWSGMLFLFFCFLCAVSVAGVVYGEHRLLDSLFAIVGFFGAGLFGCNLYPRHMLAEDAPQSIEKMFVVVFALWLAWALLYVVHGIFVINKLLGAVAVVIFALVFRWDWKRWWKKFPKSHHDSMGLADEFKTTTTYPRIFIWCVLFGWLSGWLFLKGLGQFSKGGWHYFLAAVLWMFAFSCAVEILRALAMPVESLSAKKRQRADCLPEKEKAH